MVWPLKHQYLEAGERLNKKNKKKNLVPKILGDGGWDEEGAQEAAAVGRER